MSITAGRGLRKMTPRRSSHLAPCSTLSCPAQPLCPSWHQGLALHLAWVGRMQAPPGPPFLLPDRPPQPLPLSTEAKHPGAVGPSGNRLARPPFSSPLVRSLGLVPVNCTQSAQEVQSLPAGCAAHLARPRWNGCNSKAPSLQAPVRGGLRL